MSRVPTSGRRVASLRARSRGVLDAMCESVHTYSQVATVSHTETAAPVARQILTRSSRGARSPQRSAGRVECAGTDRTPERAMNDRRVDLIHRVPHCAARADRAWDRRCRDTFRAHRSGTFGCRLEWSSLFSVALEDEGEGSLNSLCWIREIGPIQSPRFVEDVPASVIGRERPALLIANPSNDDAHAHPSDGGAMEERCEAMSWIALLVQCVHEGKA